MDFDHYYCAENCQLSTRFLPRSLKHERAGGIAGKIRDTTEIPRRWEAFLILLMAKFVNLDHPAHYINSTR